MAISSRMPTFNDFYCAINKREPFPWQSRLAAHVASTGKWYPEIGVPTGLGKTACLDIAVWWLASQANRIPIDRTAPTRIWWVVNRRLLVDSTYEHAKYISEILNNPKSVESEISQKDQEIITNVADRLRSINGNLESEPIQVIRLRGGVASQRPSSPSQPAIILSTLPMYGSRLLFRGYGSSRGMRSIDAAMAGTDSLILLDEAHLTPHLESLCLAIADCTANAINIPNESRATPRLVQLTATGDQSNENRLTLNEEDEQNSIVQQRLNAVKLLDLRVMSKKNENSLAEAACDILQYASAPASCIVFVNTPKTARKVFSRLRKLMKNDEILLLTGRMREREAELIRKRILHPHHGILASSDNQNKRTQHLIIVSTQTLEVGADIDAEYMVTEQCGVRALIQRLGRLNRFGKFKNAIAVYVHYPSKSKVEDWAVYGSEPKDLLQKLQGLENNFRKVNLSPRNVSDYLGSPMDTFGRAPELLPGILWEWTKTFFPPGGEASVEPYFSGINGSRKLVTIIWRSHIPQGNNLRLWPRISDLEAIDVPINEVREALKDDLNGGNVFRLNSDGLTIEETSNLKPGDQIVLPTDRGLMDRFGWNPEATDPVMDAALMKHGLPLDTEAIQRICGVSVSKKLLDIVLGKFDDDIEIDPQEQITRIDEILHSISQKCAHGWNPEEWNKFLSSLNKAVVKHPKEVSRLRVEQPEPETPNDDLDELSLADTATLLELHCDAVANHARNISSRIGLPPDLVEVIEYAGRLHDIGKADQRFQRWLNPEWERNSALLAKSDALSHHWETRRAEADWPRGGRHEALSARLINVWLEENPDWGDSIKRKLLIHLVISHHGRGRPLIKPVTDNTALMVEGSVFGKRVSVSANHEVVDWDQPNRFRILNDHFGPWGLSLLEAIVRLSDHVISSRRA